jgi:hypothetical protein
MGIIWGRNSERLWWTGAWRLNECTSVPVSAAKHETTAEIRAGLARNGNAGRWGHWGLPAVLGPRG